MRTKPKCHSDFVFLRNESDNNLSTEYMTEINPGLYGIKHSNRDFTNKRTWGKNQFNSSFPASLSAFLDKKGFENIYLSLNKDLKVVHQKISTSDLFGLDPISDGFVLFI